MHVPTKNNKKRMDYYDGDVSTKTPKRSPKRQCSINNLNRYSSDTQYASLVDATWNISYRYFSELSDQEQVSIKVDITRDIISGFDINQLVQAICSGGNISLITYAMRRLIDVISKSGLSSAVRDLESSPLGFSLITRFDELAHAYNKTVSTMVVDALQALEDHTPVYIRTPRMGIIARTTVMDVSVDGADVEVHMESLIHWRSGYELLIENGVLPDELVRLTFDLRPGDFILKSYVEPAPPVWVFRSWRTKMKSRTDWFRVPLADNLTLVGIASTPPDIPSTGQSRDENHSSMSLVCTRENVAMSRADSIRVYASRRCSRPYTDLVDLSDVRMVRVLHDMLMMVYSSWTLNAMTSVVNRRLQRIKPACDALREIILLDNMGVIHHDISRSRITSHDELATRYNDEMTNCVTDGDLCMMYKIRPYVCITGALASNDVKYEVQVVKCDQGVVVVTGDNICNDMDWLYKDNSREGQHSLTFACRKGGYTKLGMPERPRWVLTQDGHMKAVVTDTVTLVGMHGAKCRIIHTALMNHHMIKSCIMMVLHYLYD